jgi:hypothetical protein
MDLSQLLEFVEQSNFPLKPDQFKICNCCKLAFESSICIRCSNCEKWYSAECLENKNACLNPQLETVCIERKIDIPDVDGVCEDCNPEHPTAEQMGKFLENKYFDRSSSKMRRAAFELYLYKLKGTHLVTSDDDDMKFDVLEGWGVHYCEASINDTVELFKWDPSYESIVEIILLNIFKSEEQAELAYYKSLSDAELKALLP